MTRWVFYAVACVGILATLRYMLVPPRPVRAVLPAARPPDRAAEAFATLFARSYLTWDAARPDEHQRAMVSLLGTAVDADFGFQAPPSGTQTVQWADVAQARDGPQGDRVYTVAAQTDRNGLVYLAVDVARGPDGRLRLLGYPAVVGPPLVAAASADPDSGLADVTDGALITVVRRAVRNYLAGSANNLTADLTASARMSLPAQPLQMHDLALLKWSPGQRSVLATVHAGGPDGAEYTLRYELDMAQLEARWEVAAIEMDPTA
ncbi:MAG TPA: hypothetical protein VGY97_08960 [Solirubrobacteraceae bacterium]|nr:hypothetical protein [Solirubrobacteraceae bacterium]